MLTEKQCYTLLKNLIEFPYAQICIHAVASDILSMMEENGVNTSTLLVKYIVKAKDELSLPIIYRRLQELCKMEYITTTPSQGDQRPNQGTMKP